MTGESLRVLEQSSNWIATMAAFRGMAADHAGGRAYGYDLEPCRDAGQARYGAAVDKLSEVRSDVIQLAIQSVRNKYCAKNARET